MSWLRSRPVFLNVAATILLIGMMPALEAHAASAGAPQPSPSPANTAVAPPDQSRPPAAGQPSSSPGTAGSNLGPFTTPIPLVQQSRLVREIFGFATSESLADPTFGYPSWNFSLLGTVAFFAIHVQFNGVLVADSNWKVWSSSALTGLVNAAHSHGTKVVVTIVGPGNPVDQCDALYNGATTTLQIVNQVVAKGIDGVNIDYEGQLRTCINNNPALNASNQTLLTQFAGQLRTGLNNARHGNYLSIDTYSGSAGGTDGFFNIPNLSQYVDSFFVMAYDMDYANLPYPPLNCTSFCLNPVSPLANYNYNDTISMAQYSSVAGPGKVILGQPYYGRFSCVASPVAHATPTKDFGAATYLEAAVAISSPDVKPGTYVIHRDANDPAGLDRWDTWYDNSVPCWREMYWDDAAQLGTRYDLVNRDNLRGVGFWTLNYAGGAAELWNALETHFGTCANAGVTAVPGSPQPVGRQVQLRATSRICPDPQYEFWVLAPGASSWQMVQAYSASATFTWNNPGLVPGTYRVAVWARDANSVGTSGNAMGRWDAANASLLFNVTTCSAVSESTLSASAGVGAAVALTAHSSGCPNPNPLYQFWVLPAGASNYQMLQAYTTSATFTWNTAGLVPGTYRLGAWVEDANSGGAFGSALGRWDVSNSSLTFKLTTCSAVSESALPVSAGVGTSVALTAHSSGCPNPNPLYQFWLLAPGASSYQVLQPYSPSATATWNTASLVPGTYRLAVWVKDANSGGAFANALGRWDVSNSSLTFKVTTCSAVSESALPASAGVGASVVLSAHASGCPSPNPLYQFWLLAPGASGYQILQPYSPSTTATWNTAGLVPGTYRIAVWVNDANSGGAYGSTLGRWDTSNNSTLVKLT